MKKKRKQNPSLRGMLNIVSTERVYMARSQARRLRGMLNIVSTER